MSVELHLNNQPKELSSVGKKERETEHLVKKLWRGTLDSQRAVSPHRTDGSDAGQFSGLAFFGSWVPVLRQKWL